MSNLNQFIIQPLIVLILLMTFSIKIFAQTPSNPCEKYELQDLPLVKVRVNFHFILDKDGKNNYNALDNGLGDVSRNGLIIAQEILNTMNSGVSNLQQMSSKKADGSDHPFINSLGIEYELYTNDWIVPGDVYGGIWFWNYEPYDVTKPIVDYQSNFLPSYLKSLFGQYGENVVDIFIIGSRFYYLSNGDKKYSIGGESDGLADGGSSLRVHNLWKYAELDGAPFQTLGPTINHEFGHMLPGLTHNGAGVATESDIDLNDEATNGNDLMSYGCSCALSLVQLRKFRAALSRTDVPYLDISGLCTLNQTPIIIPANTYQIWDSYRELNQNVIIEPTGTLKITCDIKTTGKFVVKRGAKLIVQEATISNLCPTGYWRGIEVWGNPSKDHPAGDLKNYTLASDDPGVVYLNLATLYRPQEGVFTWNDANYLWPDYWGGIVQAQTTDFINHRARGAAFMQYKKSINSSFFNDCTFSSANGASGITMWDVVNVSIINSRFHSQNDNNATIKRGIISFDATPIIDHCTFDGNTYGLEAHSTYSHVQNPLKVINKCNFSKTSTYNNPAHIYSNGILGLDVLNSSFSGSSNAISIRGISSFKIDGNILTGYVNSGVFLSNTQHQFKEIKLNYFSSLNYGEGTKGIYVLKNTSILQFISNCFLHVRNDIIITPHVYFDDQGDVNTSNNNYFHTFSNNGPEYLTQGTTNPLYYVPLTNPSPKAIPHCHYGTTKPNPTLCPYGFSLHNNSTAFTQAETPMFCSNQAIIPDTSNLPFISDESNDRNYLFQKFEYYKSLVAEQEEELLNLNPNEPDYISLLSLIKTNRYYLKKYQIQFMQSYYSAFEYDSMGIFLQNEDIQDKTMLTAGLEIDKGNYVVADSILDILSNTSQEFDTYYTIEKIHLNFLKDPEENFPTTQDSLTLEEVALDTTWVANYAKALLVFYYDRTVDTNLYQLDTLQEYSRSLKVINNQQPYVFINNPIINELNIVFSESISNEKIRIEIFETMGRKVYSKEVLISDNSLKLNLSSLKGGLYLLKTETAKYNYPTKLFFKI